MQKNLRQKLISAIERYCEITGRAPATVSTQIMKDGKFYDRLKSGGDCSTSNFEKAMDWLSQNSPKSRVQYNPQHPPPN